MKLALETIDYQVKDSFPDTLVALVESIYKDIDRRGLTNTNQLIFDGSVTSEIEKAILNRLGMNVKFTKELHALAPGAIIPFFGDYFREAKEISKFNAGKLSSIFAFSHKAVTEYQQLEKYRKAQLRTLNDKEGFIDTKLAKVGGYLSEVRHYLIIDFVKLKKLGLTSAETVAVMMHELGHAFDGLEEHNRLERTNKTIYDILSDLSNKDYDKAVYKFRNKFTKAEFEEHALTDDKVRYDFCGKLAKAYLGEVKSQVANGKYSETNYENMADTFAVRFGLGKELSSALVKLMDGTGVMLPNSRVVYLMVGAMDILSMAAIFLLFPVWGAAVFMAIMMYLYNSDAVDMTYDFPMDRFNRMRNTIINAMKRLDLPKDVLRDFLTQYEYITKVLDSYMSMNGVTFELADVLLPSAREARYYSDLQKSLENSLNNQLFVKSAQLKVLS